ncbi:hypothetical protein ElyMa_004313200 [Elysia marginata]|uniref:Uncharacterized protein n=1 Tax=Elysia marginata TaxID=1093978 RepID=A0AAV4H1Z1_9GAST|nr:hypothetical protein ElyMa_004313200 [Elysia marginata]
MAESVPHVIRPTRGPCSRLVPPVAFLLVTILCMLFNTTDMTIRWPFSAKKPQTKSGTLFPNTRLLRSTESRDNLLTQAREALEYWWHIKHKESGVSSARCPYSTALHTDPTGPELEEVYGSVKQSIEIMEAMGYSNLTTCGGKYSKFSEEDSSDVGSQTDKIQGLLASVDISAASSEELIMKKFCYTPTFRPPTAANLEKDQKLVSDPAFCSRLLKLHRDIVAGKEPPLLTMFIWIPDPIEDAAKVSRRYLALNLDMFKPFVQPVLISDRRMVMAIANSIQWPCLPITEFSPDNVPVFKSSSLDVMDKFNSTFYGYARGVSIFDASLLETLLAIKEQFLRTENFGGVSSVKSNVRPTKRPNIFVYGSALFKQDLSFRSNYSAVGTMAESRASSGWPQGESSLTFLIHTKQSFTDLPPVKIDDKDLVPLLAERSLLLGDKVIDASSTILTVFNVHLQNTNEWNRIPLPATPRIENYNRVMGSTYLESLKQRMSPQKPLLSSFDTEGKVVFTEN